ncbi:PepSY domain-containing protein [Segnochrobactraceae bacterium EtOH-i3]
MVRARLVFSALLLLGPSSPAVAAEGGFSCLSQRDMRLRIQSENLVRPGSVRSALDGDVVGLELCERNQLIVYIVTVLAPNGAVQRVVFDARSGKRMRP